MKNCPFCEINQDQEVLFITKYFVFMSAKTKITPNHHLLISKHHIKSEVELGEKIWIDYQYASKLAWNLMKNLSNQDPLIFINPSQMQSVGHFHKHYVDGIFGIHGVANALKTSLV